MKDYKKILEGVVDIIRTTEKSDIGFANICTYIGENCPELAESKEEKNIKDLIDELKCSLRAANCQNEACNGGHEKRIALLEWAIAWIEKRKPVEHLELKAGHWYICYRAYCCRADHLTVKEGERFMCEKDGIVKGFVIKDAEKYFKECSAPAPMENEGKNSPKWSKDDEEEFKIAIETLHKAGQHSSAMWLKTIKQRMEE